MGKSPCRSRKREAGFTFMEVVLVLLVVSAVTLASVHAAGRVPSGGGLMRFEEQLKADIQTLQSYTLANRVTGRLVFTSDGTGYIGSGENSEILFRRALPEGVTVSRYGTLRNIEFNPRGSVAAFGTIHFDAPSGTLKLKVHIGKGRVSFER